MKKLKLGLACMAIITATSCSSDDSGVVGPSTSDNQYTKIELSQGESQVAEAGYEFAWNLFGKLNGANPGKNVCVSPLSANIALTMLLNGADGETLEEIVNALGLEGMSVEEINENSKFLTAELINRDKNCILNVANSLWVDEKMSVKNEYKSILSDYFEASTQNTTRETFAGDVNAWCRKQTHGLISDLVQPGEAYDWALLNAVYYRNAWHEDVKFKSIGEKEFFNSDGSRSLTAFMQGKIPCFYGETASARHAHIPFGNGAYRMSISLPNDGASLQMCIEELKNREAFYRLKGTNMELTMPKFEFKYDCLLNDVLKSLGIIRSFDTQLAQFPHISDRYDEGMHPSVSSVKQGCSIKVDEKGAVAASVTITGMTGSSLGSAPMVVDRPFIFTIYEQSTGCILFAGKIEIL